MTHVRIHFYKNNDFSFTLSPDNDSVHIVKKSSITAIDSGDIIIKYLKKDVRGLPYDGLLELSKSIRMGQQVTIEVLKPQFDQEILHMKKVK